MIDPNLPPTTLNNKGKREIAIFTLARFGHTAWLSTFLQYMRIDSFDQEGNGLLHIAAIGGHESFCDALILAGIIGKVGQYQWPRNGLGRTPFHSAAEGGQVRLMQFFVKKYAA